MAGKKGFRELADRLPVQWSSHTVHWSLCTGQHWWLFLPSTSHGSQQMRRTAVQASLFLPHRTGRELLLKPQHHSRLQMDTKPQILCLKPEDRECQRASGSL